MCWRLGDAQISLKLLCVNVSLLVPLTELPHSIMATITIGAGVGAAAFGAAAVAGAVGLGLAGLALAGRRRGRRFRGGRRRFGRSVDKDAAAVERVMSLIREEDVSGCGRRLACELGGRTEASLSEEEQAILDLVGPSIRPGEDMLPGSAVMEYRAARAIGAEGGDCGLAYPTCALDGAQLMNAVTAYLP